MSEQNSENPAENPPPSIFGVIIHSFFVIPFLIAVFCVLLFAAVRILTFEQHTAYDYLNDIKSGGATKRWQSAFELSKLVSNPQVLPKEERFYSEIQNAFVKSKNDDDRVRQYLAIAMGRLKHEGYIQPLLDALKDEKEENLYALIYALGLLEDKKAIPALKSFLDHPNGRIRLSAVIALGNIPDRSAIPKLKAMLNDSEPNIQGDAAIALA